VKFKTPTGRLKEINIAAYRVDFDGEQGSDFAAEVLDLLYPYWKYDIVTQELPVAGTRLRYDYVNHSKRIACECDGVQHDDPLAYHNRGSKAVWLAQIKRDDLKNRMAAAQGWTMVRIKPDDMPKLRKDIKGWFLEMFDITL